MNDAGLDLFRPLADSRIFREVIERLDRGERGVCVTGLVEGSRALLLSLLLAQGRKLLLVVPDDSHVEAYRRDLAALAGLHGVDGKTIVTMPALDGDPYDAIAPHPEVLRERVLALDRLIRGRADILIAPVRTLLQPLPAAEQFRSWTRLVRADDTLSPDRFVLSMMGLGYRRVDIVSAPGEVSRRGGIVDIFPPTSDEPVRIELFGDTVESLRAFDTDHQRSTGNLEEVSIGPAVESPPDDAALGRLSTYLGGRLEQAEKAGETVRALREQLDTLQNEGYWPGIECLAAITAESPALLFDYVEEMTLVVSEAELTEHELLRTAADLVTAYEQSGNRVLPPPAELFADTSKVRDRMRDPELYLQELAGDEPPGAVAILPLSCRTARPYDGRIQDAVADFRESLAARTRTICVMRAKGSADRLIEILKEYGLDPLRSESAPPHRPAERETGGLYVGIGGLRGGFELTDLGLLVVTERDLFGEKRKVTDRKSRSRKAFISDFRDLKPGDHVVHVDHGIARYGGLGRPKGGSLNRDFMILEFQDRARLFVPADRLDVVQKYNGAGGSKPKLDRLGGPGWERVKAKVRKSVESMARELLDLYARRKAATGRAFAPDTAWQRELEAAFPFELTPDQSRALTEIKQDMESKRTTDRLLVGDVGYGKTEVAIRAAFKAVMEGCQVAVLAPTTVLTAQHFDTFRERYAPFPVKVAMISRFRSAAQIRKTLEDVKLGMVDVLIGTHRLLSKDVVFRNLGLLVVDEEQRFGVAHKERMKQLSIGIDVLSMTATPIPRTLQMSLAGVRDLSVIETPPQGRMAIKSYIIPFRKNVLAQAIRQELQRKGQVFVVHNKIETLPSIARAVNEMVPEARVGVAHGQMGEHRLEAVMLKFVEYDLDVLVTTTIIENGLDIPRANTIIVNRADHFGLAQLYQLRGRVGRSDEHAYAYFVVPSRHSLSPDARKRLRALQEFSELGAGFRLAAADLEIRGAGELLGAKQHGHIAALGFDLYCQLLEGAVHKLQGAPEQQRQSVALHLGVDIKIPESFLPDAGDRLVVYKRLAQAQDGSEIERLQTETEDRYGHLPEAARNLFRMGSLRLLAESAGVKAIDLAEGKLQIRFHERPPLDPTRILEVVQSENGSLTPSGMLLLPAPPRGVARIHAVHEVLSRMLGRPAA